MNSSIVKNQIQWQTENTSVILAEENYITNSYFEEPTYIFESSNCFSNDFWDFRHLDKVHNLPDKYKFNFSEIQSSTFRVVLKFLVIRELYLLKNDIASVKSSVFNPLKRFIHYLNTEKFIDDPKYISPKIVESFISINFSKTKLRTRNHFLVAMRKLLRELEYGGLRLDYSAFEPILTSIPPRLIKAESMSSKTPNIPLKLYQRIKELAAIDMDNEELVMPQKIVACLITILAHTGMRGGELCLLEANKLKDLSIRNNARNIYYLEFLTYKTTPEKDGRWTQVIAEEPTVKAYRKLEKLTKGIREQFNTPFLYINKYKKGRRFTYQTFERNLDLFCYRHQLELGFELLTEFERTQIFKVEISKRKALNSSLYKKEDIGKVYHSVNPHQFRVAVANELRNKGVSFEWIQRHMNHMTEEMTSHYFRDDDLIKQTLFTRSSPDGAQLETNRNSTISELEQELTETELQQAYDTINNFLKKKKLNVFKDIDEIINILKRNTLRETTVGICKKAVGMLCERQERLVTFEKWYYISPQIIDINSFDFTYKRFIEKAKIVDHNKKVIESRSEYERQYNLEKDALQNFYDKCFAIEYDMVCTKLNELGRDSFILSFPRLKEIVQNMDVIDKEIEQWISKLKLKRQ